MKPPAVLYIAGPMTGHPDFNFPAFHAAAAALRKQGFGVLNPAENFGGRQDLPWLTYMRQAIAQVAVADALAMLPGWRTSKGARLEVHVAETLGLPVVNAETLAPEPMLEPTILEEAKRLVHGDRGADYGHPLDDFTKTAAGWGVILGAEVTAEQVGLCMVWLKICRQLNRAKRDNLTDGAGYFETVHMIGEERKRRAAQA